MEWEKASETEEATKIPSSWLYLHYYDALNVLFRIENALRILVYVVLKNAKRDKWLDVPVSSDEATDTTIGALAKKRIAQHLTFGYLGYVINAPMMHLTSGELVRIITDTHWTLFKDYFPASKDVVTLKLKEIGDIRNALAHFRPLTLDDVEAVKQNAKQVLSTGEAALWDMVTCTERVPTNTSAEWYEELRSLGTDTCSFLFFQSTDGRWINMILRYKARIVKQTPDDPKSRVRYDVLNIDTPQVLNLYDELRSLTIYLTEWVARASMPEDYKPLFMKRLSFTFSRSALETEFDKISKNLKQLLADIDKETELVAEDSLAKGKLIALTRVLAKKQTSGKGLPVPPAQAVQAAPEITKWTIQTELLRCPSGSHHPNEYWGSISFTDENLISGSDEFPWMPTSISSYEPW
jgi:hypothetical protein